MFIETSKAVSSQSPGGEGGNQDVDLPLIEKTENTTPTQVRTFARTRVSSPIFTPRPPAHSPDHPLLNPIKGLLLPLPALPPPQEFIFFLNVFRLFLSSPFLCGVRDVERVEVDVWYIVVEKTTFFSLCVLGSLNTPNVLVLALLFLAPLFVGQGMKQLKGGTACYGLLGKV